MKSKSRTSWVVAALCFAILSAWALLASSVIRNQGDTMIGFHPAILGIFPGIICAAFTAVILFFMRQWPIGLALGLGSLALFLVLRNAHAIEERAWRDAIVLHSQANERALTAIQGDLQSTDLSLLWEDKKLTPLQGFNWYGTNHFSAPNGVYLGFRIDGVPHARIQKIRHGWRGVALVPSEAALSALSKRTGMKYSRVGAGNWFIWSTE